jgi:hypothetical protein
MGKIELTHRLLVPIKAALFEHAAELQRSRQAPAGRAVEHQNRVVAGPFAKVAAELRVLLPVAPGVQLEGDEALVRAFLDVTFIFRHLVPVTVDAYARIVASFRRA